MATKHAGIILEHVRKLLTAQETEQLSDRELLRRFARERDEAAFATLVRRHGPMVLQSCERVLHNRHDAEDGFQATFLVLARKAASRSWQESVSTWLYLVAYRLALKIRAGRDRHLPQRMPAVERLSEDPLTVASSREICGVLDEELTRLPEKCRAPLVLCSLEGFTRDEAARQLGWSLRTFRRRLERGRALLRQRLVRRGLPLSVIFATVLGTEEAVQAALPLGLAQSTVQMAMQLALGKAVPAGLISSRAAALAEGVLKGMCISKVKIALAAVLAVCVAGAGAGLAWQRVPAAKPLEQKSLKPQLSANQQAGGRPEKAGQPVLDRYGDSLPPDAVARVGTSRFWCGADQKTQVTFTPDGGKIVAAHWDGVFVFDATTGRPYRHISTFAAQRSVISMSLSPDGNYLALATSSRKDSASGIQIWDLAAGQLVREFQDIGPQRYEGVRFSPDGKLLASYSYDSKTINLWDPATGKEIRHWRLAEGSGSCFTFSPDSKTLLVGDLRAIHFWDTVTGQEVRRMEDHPGSRIYRLVLTQDGTILATQALTQAGEAVQPYSRDTRPQPVYHQDNKVHFWDAATGKKLRHIEVLAKVGANRVSDPSRIYYFQFSPDTKTLATASGDAVLRLWDVATGKELRHWGDTSGYVTAFAFSPDGTKVVSIGSPNHVRLWDTVTGKELGEHPTHPSGVHVLALSPDGRTLASAGWEREVRLWDAATGRPQGTLTPVDHAVHALHFSADGRTLTMVEGTVDTPHFSAERKTVTMHGSDGKARVWDIATGKELRQFPAPVEEHGWLQVISPDGKSWASESVDIRNGTGNAFVWDAATGKKRQVFVGSEAWIGALGFSPDSGTLYSWSFLETDRRVRVWDVATGKRLREFAAGAEQGVCTGTFSPNGHWFACGSRENLLLLYDMATGTAARRIEVAAMFYGNCRFAISPDSRTLAVGDEQGIIHLVELASGKFRRRLVGGHQGGITALLFSTDGERLVSGSTDTTALVWDLTGRLHARRKPLSAADLDACWTDLVGEDGERAYESIRRLAASPTEMVPYLGKKLQPAASADAKRVDGLIADLASDQFTVRTQASKELEKLGEAAAAACRQALARRPSPELRRRLEMLLQKQERARFSPSLPRLQMLRALEALELAGTPETRQLLHKLAGGAPEAYLTREAKTSLERLAKRSVTVP